MFKRLICGAFACVAGLSSLPTLADDYKVINADAKFPEGPIFVGSDLFYVETGADSVTKWDGKTNKRIFQQKGCGANSVINYKDNLLVACYFSNSVVEIDKEGKVLKTYTKGDNGSTLIGPNDFAPDAKGGVYFTTSGPWEPNPIVGKVFHIDLDGKVRQLAADISYANGILVSKDGTRLLVGEPEAAGRIISFAIEPDGTLTDRRVFLRLPKDDPQGGADAYPDGFKWGPDGNLYVGEYSSGRVGVFTPEGKFIKAYDVPTKGVPNLTFSPDGKKMYLMVVDNKDKEPWDGKVLEVDVK